MFFNRYFIKSGNMPNFKYLKIPLSHEQKYWSENQEKTMSFITLDLLDDDESLKILISNPDWETHKPGNDIESVCSNLHVLIKSFGVAGSAKPIKWHFINNSSFPYKIQEIEFEEKDSWLFITSKKQLAPRELPFDTSKIDYLFQKDS